MKADRNVIEQAYAFFHQKLKVYEHSTSENEMDHIEDCIADYANSIREQGSALKNCHNLTKRSFLKVKEMLIYVTEFLFEPSFYRINGFVALSKFRTGVKINLTCHQ